MTEPEKEQEIVEDLEDSQIFRYKMKEYCARCYHSFCLPLESQEESDNSDQDSESDDDDDDNDSVSPIFQEDPEDVEEQILDEITDYMQSNPLVIWRASFEKDLVKEISTFLFEEWSEDDLCEEYDLPEIQDWVKRMVAYYFATESEMPPRQGGAPLTMSPLKRVSIANKLRIIDAIPTATTYSRMV